MSGLVLITLPIGNNKDLTLRAKETLESIQYIVAEDTRVFRVFCKHNAIELSGKIIESFHDHSDIKKTSKVLRWLEQHRVAVVSDAGSPLISDPAYPLVKTVLDNGLPIFSIPGVSAVTTALELSGLPTNPFHFHGFIARDNGKKKKFQEDISHMYGTHIFFEGVSRIEDTMNLLCGHMPNNDFCIARELTKEYETVYRFKGQEWDHIKKEIIYKGEFVILVHNSEQKNATNTYDVNELAHDIIQNGVHPKKLSKLLALVTGMSSKEIYHKLKKD